MTFSVLLEAGVLPATAFKAQARPLHPRPQSYNLTGSLGPTGPSHPSLPYHLTVETVPQPFLVDEAVLLELGFLPCLLAWYKSSGTRRQVFPPSQAKPLTPIVCDDHR